MQAWIRRSAALLTVVAVSSIVAAGSVSAQEAEAPAQATAEPVAEAAPEEDWLTRAKKPVSWLELEGDFRARWEYSKAVPDLQRSGPNSETNLLRFRSRLGVKVKPVESIELNARVAWEFFVYHKPNARRHFDANEALFDKLNVTWKETFGGMKNTLVVGRQEITDLGNGWLIFDGTPLDGSRTIFFDAVRNTLEIPDAKTTIDLAYMQQGASENKHITPFGFEAPRYFAENDEIGAFVYVRNKSIERTQLDGFYIYRKTDAVTARGYDSDLHTVGGSVEHAFNDNWIVRAALAEQFGKREGQDVWAQAFNGKLTYKFRDAWDTDAFAGYEFLSGNDKDSGKWNEFDPLWGRWPQFSEIIASAYRNETLPGYATNLHRLYAGAITRPKPFEIIANYHLLFADHRYPTGHLFGQDSSGHFRGQLVTAAARWVINPHLSMQVLGEVFFPSDFYDRDHRSTAVFARYEIVFKW
ncbi:MAG: alginate export family protein [Phycisphaerae bacterium]|nr:alginate export family protein [Phycisphaerae bacterium]